MKYKKLIYLLPFFAILLLSTKTVQAESEPILVGEINQKYDFMIGDYPESEDFTISGNILYNGITYDASEFKITWMDTEIQEATIKKEYDLRIKVQNVPTIFTTYVPSIVAFDSTVTNKLDGTTTEIDKISRTVEDEVGNLRNIYYYDDMSIHLKNKFGKKLNGEMKFSNNIFSPKYGYNLIKYYFTSNDSRYSNMSGSFIVKYNKNPKIKLYATKIKIDLIVGNYIVEVDGKEYDSYTISNLESDTKYKIKIYQKEDKNFDKTLLWTTTVTTKAK